MTADEDIIARCDICDTNFKYQQRADKHQETTKHQMNKLRQEIPDRFDVSLDSDNYYYVYTVLITPIDDDREFYYVGMSRHPVQRIDEHSKPSQQKTNFPSEDKDDWVKMNYTFVEVVDVEEHESPGKARMREREKMFEVSKEFNTNMVLGGR